MLDWHNFLAVAIQLYLYANPQNFHIKDKQYTFSFIVFLMYVINALCKKCNKTPFRRVLYIYYSLWDVKYHVK